MTIMSFMVPEIWSVMGNFFLSFWTIFYLLPCYPETTLKIKNSKNSKKDLEIIILQMCNINDNHTMYSLWDMEHNRNLVLRTSGESLMVFSTMVNLYFLYSMAWRCCSKAKLFAKNFSNNSNLDNLGTSSWFPL